jgi:hypothetical protein
LIFSTRHLEDNVLFDFNNISLPPVHMHKHLGAIFSNDCMWRKHIDVRIPKTDYWGTPAFNSPVLDIASLITTRCFRLER